MLIPFPLHDAMVEHCRRDAPLECCGLLGGVAPRAQEIYPLRNAAESKSTRYDADANDLIAAVQDMRAKKTEIVAIYHSHPRWVAVPSDADLRLNFHGSTPRIIVSLLDERPDVRIWRYFPDGYQELPWRLVPVVQGWLSE